METSDKLDKLGADLISAQAEMGGSVKDANNPFFKSKYSSLTSVWKACKEALHNHGFSIIQSPIDDNGRVGVETMLLHKSGQFVKDKFTLGVKKQNDPQADGSSITYARRYALAAFVGICPVDDDAEAAMLRISPEQPQKKKPAITIDQYNSAVAAYLRDGNLDKVRERCTVSKKAEEEIMGLVPKDKPEEE